MKGNWIQLTSANRSAPVLVNLDRVLFIEPTDVGGTIIQFQGDGEGECYVRVREEFQTILTRIYQ